MNRDHWKEKQWCAYLISKDIPIYPDTLNKITALLETTAEPINIADIAAHDPLFTLRLLNKAEKVRSRKTLVNDTTTIMSCVLQLGIEKIILDVKTAPITNINQGLNQCINRAYLAAKLAKQWSIFRADIIPDEIVLSSLLSDLGELLLWVFAPELPEKAINALKTGTANRNKDAQILTCGFGFKHLSIELAQAYNLPLPVKQLMGLADNVRSKIAKCAVQTSRHILAKDGIIAIPDDILTLKEICPNIKISDIVKSLHLSDEQNKFIYEQLTIGQ